MSTLDEATGMAFLDTDSVCAVVYSPVGLRDWSVDLNNAEVPGGSQGRGQERQGQSWVVVRRSD